MAPKTSPKETRSFKNKLMQCVIKKTKTASTAECFIIPEELLKSSESTDDDEDDYETSSSSSSSSSSSENETEDEKKRKHFRLNPR